jgi:diacylglycerol kinase (ATP)
MQDFYAPCISGQRSSKSEVFMIVFVNPHAGGRTAKRKWDMIEPALRNCGFSFTTHILNGRDTMKQLVLDALHCGQTDFAAAGGDGTVNDLLNAILKTASNEQLQTIRFGAIGLGSSNDFHKPHSGPAFINGIPCKINFESVQNRDIGCVNLGTEGRFLTRYFLNNASLGITADANARFNAPGRMLKYLKHSHNAIAILATAFQTIATFRNIDVTLESADHNRRRVQLSNMAFLKNPHFAGTLYYNVPFSFDSGRLQIALCPGRSRLGLLKLMRALSGGLPPEHAGLEFWETTSITIKSQARFALEFDGEVATTREAGFYVLPQHLKVCTC